MFISGEDAANAPDVETDAQLGTNFLDILGNVATSYLNTAVPGLGPIVNPGMYKDQAASQQQAQQQQAAQAQAIAAQQMALQKKDGLPSWVIPASIAGGVGLLAIVLALTLGGRRKNPTKYGSARDLVDAHRTKGYYSNARGHIGVRSEGWVKWFSWDSGKQGYRMTGSTRSAEGADYRKIA